MGLRDKFQSTAASSVSPEVAAASAAPSIPPAATPTSVAPPAASGSSSPAAASAATTIPSPASSTPPTAGPGPAGSRDLGALRARLAGNGQVNPPEAVAALVDSLADPCTRETPDGGAEPLPNHPDAEKAMVSAAVPGPAADAATQPKRKRRTKAEMEAARAAEAAQAQPSVSEPAAKVAPTAEPPRYSPSYYEAHVPVSTGVPESHGVDTEEYRVELAAAAAETEGHIILTDELREVIRARGVANYLVTLSLEGAVELVRLRLPRGVKSLEVEA